MFKKCSFCGFIWPDRESFISDPNITIVGYQVNFKNLEKGFFLFNHSCNATICMDISTFRDLYEGPIFTKRETGHTSCPGYCLKQSELGPCSAECECAYVT